MSKKARESEESEGNGGRVGEREIGEGRDETYFQEVSYWKQSRAESAQ